jgi:predicted pyridoxine 5'-phosphate oxidase superfamily flavin-nucleotide-binding protein
MSLSTNVIEFVNGAESRALATNGPAGINVVPISMAKAEEDAIWLFDFFMDKTVSNINADAEVALTTWTGYTGLQIKATATYVTDGADFVQAVAWVKTKNPDRETKGLIILTPSSIYDVSPGGVFASEELRL